MMTHTQLKRIIKESMEMPTDKELFPEFIDDFVSKIAEHWMRLVDYDGTDDWLDVVSPYEMKLKTNIESLVFRLSDAVNNRAKRFASSAEITD